MSEGLPNSIRFHLRRTRPPAERDSASLPTSIPLACGSRSRSGTLPLSSRCHFATSRLSRAPPNGAPRPTRGNVRFALSLSFRHLRRSAVIRFRLPVEGRRKSCALLFLSAAALGRSSVAGGGSLFLPCLPSVLPCPVGNLPRFSFASAARPRPCALTLCPGLRSRYRRFLFGRGAAPAAAALLIAARACPLPLAGARAPLRSRSPRHAAKHTRRAVRFPSVACRGCRFGCLRFA